MEIITTDVIYLVCIAVITCIIALCFRIKTVVANKVNTETKEKIAKTVVYACEQMYSNLIGADKLKKATEYLTDILENYDIEIDTAELRLLIESAVRQMKNDSTSILSPILSSIDDSEDEYGDTGVDESDYAFLSKGDSLITGNCETVDDLPESPNPGSIYLVGNNIGEGFDLYTANADREWECKGHFAF